MRRDKNGRVRVVVKVRTTMVESIVTMVLFQQQIINIIIFCSIKQTITSMLVSLFFQMMEENNVGMVWVTV